MRGNVKPKNIFDYSIDNTKPNKRSNSLMRSGKADDQSMTNKVSVPSSIDGKNNLLSPQPNRFKIRK